MGESRGCDGMSSLIYDSEALDPVAPSCERNFFQTRNLVIVKKIPSEEFLWRDRGQFGYLGGVYSSTNGNGETFRILLPWRKSKITLPIKQQ